MIVKNIGKKTIGFGTLVLPPDAKDVLPDGFGKEHPTVSFYFKKGWIEEVDGGGIDNPLHDLTAQSIQLPADPPGGDNGGGNKSVDRMSLEELKTLASEMGIEVLESDTRKPLIEKIKAGGVLRP
jgi:hypothetical protein